MPSLTVYMPASAVCGPSFPVVVAGAPTNLVVSGSSITFLEVGTDVSEVYNLNSIMGVAINHNSELATGPIVMTVRMSSEAQTSASARRLWLERSGWGKEHYQCCWWILLCVLALLVL